MITMEQLDEIERTNGPYGKSLNFETVQALVDAARKWVEDQGRISTDAIMTSAKLCGEYQERLKESVEANATISALEDRVEELKALVETAMSWVMHDLVEFGDENKDGVMKQWIKRSEKALKGEGWRGQRDLG